MNPSLAKAGLVVFGLFSGLVIAEVGLRALRVSAPRTVEPHPTRGVVPRPDLEDDYRREGASHISVNHEGFRDVNWSVSKPPGTVRIAVIGDSFVAAIQVEKDDRFTERLGRELARRGAFGGKPVEVQNFGVSNYGTGEELLVYEEVAARYSPDVVILVFFTGNDVEDNSKALNGDPRRAYFKLRDGRLEADTAFRSTPFFRVKHPFRDFLLDHFRVAQLATRGMMMLAPQRRSRTQHPSLLDGSAGELGISEGTFFEPKTAEWQDAWNVTEAEVARLHSEVVAHQARFLLLTVSPGLEAHPDAEFRRRLLEKSGLGDLLYPDRRLQALGAREGFPVLVTGPVLAAEAARRNVFLYGFSNTALGTGHFNVEGHAVVATLVADALVKLEAEVVP